MIRKRVVESAKECIKQQRTKSEMYGKIEAVFIEMDTDPTVSVVGLVTVFVCVCNMLVGMLKSNTHNGRFEFGTG